MPLPIPGFNLQDSPVNFDGGDPVSGQVRQSFGGNSIGGLVVNRGPSMALVIGVGAVIGLALWLRK